MGILGNNLENNLDNIVKIFCEIKRIIDLKINIIVIDPNGMLSYKDGYKIALDYSRSPKIKVAENFFDLSAGKFNFYQILNRLTDCPEVVVFWNIDKIPENNIGPDFLENIVYCALRREEIPSHHRNMMYDFSQKTYVAFCKEIPEYLQGRLSGVYILDVDSILNSEG